MHGGTGFPSVLTIVAHPDDETIGVGGSLASFASQGWRVGTCILSGGAEARHLRPGDDDLQADTLTAHAMLGLPKPIVGTFPNIRFNVVPHLELVQFIERAMEETQADLIMTHHPSDLNDDHGVVSRAAQAAARLWMRRPGLVPPLQGFYFFEVLSSTDWALPSNNSAFAPSTFVDIEAHLELKIRASQAYRHVLREHPHSRSVESIRALARLRGAQAGVLAAEALQCAFARIGGLGQRLP